MSIRNLRIQLLFALATFILLSVLFDHFEYFKTPAVDAAVSLAGACIVFVIAAPDTKKQKK